MANKKRLIDANELHESLRESLEELRKIRDGLASDVEKQICNGQIASFVEAILRVKDAPTVDAVEVVHARWEERYIPNGKYVAWDGFYCSACGNKAAKSHYCPYCGAKMDGGNEDG